MLGSEWFAREQIERHSLAMHQFIDFRQSVGQGGNRLVEAYNSSGLHFTILPDRGLDVWSASYKGLPLTWLSPGSPHPPTWGQSWLREFNGGLQVTCGLTHVGPAENDPLTDGGRDLHGLYTRLPAYGVIARGAWEGERYVMTLEGSVSEARLHGEQLRLDRIYRMVLGEPAFSWTDTVTNTGTLRAPLMVLYHINLGYPLVQAGAQLDVAATTRPRDAAARAGIDTWPHYAAPRPDYAEQVFFHHCHMAADGTARAALFTPTFGVLITWDARSMPYLTQWKNTRQGPYVNGVEPGNCIPEGQVAANKSGRLVWLEPGEAQTFTCAIRVLDGAEAVAEARAQIAADRASGTPVPGVILDDYPA